jgi:hypothetical protein
MRKGERIGWAYRLSNTNRQSLSPGAEINITAINSLSLPAGVRPEQCRICTVQVSTTEPRTVKLICSNHGGTVPSSPAGFNQQAAFIGFGIHFENMMLPE